MVNGSSRLSAPPDTRRASLWRAEAWRLQGEGGPVVLIALLALALTAAYYGLAYRTTVLAEDRIRGLFVEFQSLEFGPEPFRWSKGAGRFCLPAIGPTRPPAGLELRLLGSALTATPDGSMVDRAELGVGALSVPLRIAPEARSYRMLLPPAAEGGPVCLTLRSATVDPGGSGRVVGVGLREASLWKLAPGGAPPPGQLLVNLWLGLGGYWLVRRFGLPRLPALLGVVVVALAVGAPLIGGMARLAPDLPFWSAWIAGALGATLGARLIYERAAGALADWQRELLGVTLVALLLGVGWALLARLEGYVWPYPLMARGGTVFGWSALPAIALGVAYIALTVRWLGADLPSPPWLVIGAGWLAAVALPVSLKWGLRGWESLFQTFAVQEGNYIEDLPRIGGDPLGFLRGYVELMPELALHNKTHPPGGTLFLWAVDRFVAPGPEAAAWVVIALSALVVWPTYRLSERMLGRQAAALAVAIAVLLPAFMIYAATSMDALFAVAMGWALFWIYAALVLYDTPGSHPGRQLMAAAAAGAWIALGLCFSFTTLMLAFVVLALAARRVAMGPRRGTDLARWVAVGGVMAGTVLLLLGLLWAATGYNSVAAFFQGVANNRVDVGERVSPLGLSSYLFFLAVNAVAYGCFLGPWVVYRLGVSGREAIARLPRGPWEHAEALSLGMAVLLLGMLLSGLFYREIERVWLFSHPLSAGALVGGIMQQTGRRRLILAALLLGSLLLHSVIFRATLRVSW